MIAQTTIDKVRQLPIEQVIGKHVELKPKGANLVACSPFTSEKTPSFTVSPSKGIFKCFSSGKGGDGISFVMELESLNFLEAVENIAAAHNIAVEYTTNLSEEEQQAYNQEQQRKTAIRVALTFAQEYYQSNKLPNIPKARQWNASIRKKFGIGYAKETWDGLLYTASTQQYSEQSLEQADLIIPKKKGGYFDKFRDRLMFPIHDHLGHVVAFVARKCKDDNPQDVKYLYSSDKVWNKRNFLFGLHLAKDAIRKEGFVYLVEGHTDVIAFHRKGIENVVAIGGSTISNEQIQLLKRYTNYVVIVPDNDLSKPDNPGIKALHKNAEELIKQGVEVKVLVPYSLVDKLESIDPEEFLNQFNENNTDILTKWLQKPSEYILDFLLRNLQEKAKEGTREKMDAINKLSEVISSIINSEYRDLVFSDAQKLWSDFKQVKSEKAKKEKEESSIKTIEMGWQYSSEGNWQNLVPEDIDWEEFEPFYLQNGYFEYGNRVWTAKVDYQAQRRIFSHASNFIFDVLFHLYDDEFPKRLVKLTNVQNREMIVDVRTDDMSTASAFKKFAERCGNYLWSGGNAIEKVKEYLYAKEKSGVLLETLGHQKQGFYVFSNGAYDYKFKQWIPCDESGVMLIKHKHYYVPSGNQVYADNEHKYGTEKLFLMKQGIVNFEQWAKLYSKAYLENSRIGTMFVIATIFSDLIYQHQRSFPLIFIFGRGGSGKGAFIKRLLAFFGEERQPLKLSSKANTDKGLTRSLAQYSNAPLLLDEYVKDRTLDEFLKGIYDRDGYAKAVRDSRFGTETTPCVSTALVTGNEEPTDEPLLQRCIYLIVNKPDYSDEQSSAYRELLDAEAAGVGQVAMEVMQHRNLLDAKYKDALRKCNDELKAKASATIPRERMRGNMSVLLACFDVLKPVLKFPFTRQQLLDTLIERGIDQMKKIETGSEVALFFNVFQFMYQRGEISERTHYLLQDNKLFIRLKFIYPIYQKFYQELEKKRPPSKNTLGDTLKDCDSFIEHLPQKKFDKDKNYNCYVFDLDKTGIELLNSERTEPDAPNHISASSTEREALNNTNLQLDLNNHSDETPF